MEESNISAFLFINQYAGINSLLDAILITAAKAMPYAFIMVLIYLWFSSSVERKRSSFNAGLSVLLGLLTSYIISIFYYHSRPFVDQLGTQLIEHAPDSSFPSDHTTFIFCIAIMLLFNKSTRTIGSVLSVFSCISGVARVFGGVHYPLDIVGAILVALFSSVVVFSLRHKTSCLVTIITSRVKFL